MVVALILFIIDSLLMVGFYLLAGGLENGIFDIVIHAWVMYYLIIGVKYGAMLKKMPIEEEIDEAKPVVEAAYNEVISENEISEEN